MPLYEFVCRNCGHRFEELVGSHVGRDEAGVTCPRVRREGARASGLLLLARSSTRLTARPEAPLGGKRGIDRGGAKQRFRKQRAAERARSGRRGG